MNAYNKQKYTKTNDPYMIKIGSNKREHTDLIIFFTCSTEKYRIKIQYVYKILQFMVVKVKYVFDSKLKA